jgi:cleavage and polyadenylation specificity factor subunit 5
MRRTVEGILVVHDHGHPHILMLQIANAFFKLYVPESDTLSRKIDFHLRLLSPGDYLLPGEDEISGLKKRLDDRLAPPASSGLPSNVTDGAEWEIGDCLAQWWRPNFETFMVSTFIQVASHNSEPSEFFVCAINIDVRTRSGRERKFESILSPLHACRLSRPAFFLLSEHRF